MNRNIPYYFSVRESLDFDTEFDMSKFITRNEVLFE